MPRKRHPKKAVENALRYAEKHGWHVVTGGSHAWGKIYCPNNDKDCRCGEFCITSVWSTPADAANYGMQIRRVVDNCTSRKNKSTWGLNMNTYEFELKFSLPVGSQNPELFVEKLAEAGCTDALVGVGQAGRLAFHFTRVAESAIEAVLSAVKNINKVIPEAILIEASPDLVGLSDIAKILGYSRQNIRKLMMNNLVSFPTPIHEGKTILWHLSSVLKWIKESQRYEVDELLLDIANTNMQLNFAKESRKLDASIQKQFLTGM